jgi:predicted ArsR family transcriptional regulator
MSDPSRQLDIAEAVALLNAARAVFLDFTTDDDSLRLPAVAKRLGVGTDWVREHLSEFPNAWRLPAGEIIRNGEGRNVGELRIPVKDIRAFEQRQRIRRLSALQPA